MKKFTLLFVSALVSSFTFAGGPEDNAKYASGIAVVKSTATSYKLFYKAELVADVKVEIFDGKDQLLFSETIKKSSGFVRPYNFESLVEGEYTIRVDNGSNWMTETVEYKSGKVERLAHLTSLEDGKYLLTVAKKGEDHLTVRIFNESGQTVYSSSYAITGDFGQIYDLSQLPGSFSFEITGKDGNSKTLNK